MIQLCFWQQIRHDLTQEILHKLERFLIVDQDFIDIAPERGIKVKTKFGTGVVCGYEPLKKALVVVFENENKLSILLEEVEVTNERVQMDDDR